MRRIHQNGCIAKPIKVSFQSFSLNIASPLHVNVQVTNVLVTASYVLPLRLRYWQNPGDRLLQQYEELCIHRFSWRVLDWAPFRSNVLPRCIMYIIKQVLENQKPIAITRFLKFLVLLLTDTYNSWSFIAAHINGMCPFLLSNFRFIWG